MSELNSQLKKPETEIDSFERKIVIQIWRPIREIDNWGISYSDEVHRLYDEPCRNISVMLKGVHWSGQTTYG